MRDSGKHYSGLKEIVDRNLWRALKRGRSAETQHATVSTPEEFRPAYIERILSGDRAAEERLLARIRPILHTYFIKRVGLKPEVDDLVQNTLVRIHRGLPDLIRSDRFMGFAMKAALFELHDLYRGRYSGRETLFDPQEPPEHARSATGHAARLDVEKALSAISPKARQILELREYGYRYKEIADMIDTSEAAVKMQVKRAFERMRKVLVA